MVEGCPCSDVGGWTSCAVASRVAGLNTFDDCVKTPVLLWCAVLLAGQLQAETFEYPSSTPSIGCSCRHPWRPGGCSDGCAGPRGQRPCHEVWRQHTGALCPFTCPSFPACCPGPACLHACTASVLNFACIDCLIFWQTMQLPYGQMSSHVHACQKSLTIVSESEILMIRRLLSLHRRCTSWRPWDPPW